MTILAGCPKCKAGYMLPMSWKNWIFHHWECSNPSCGYKVGKE